MPTSTGTCTCPSSAANPDTADDQVTSDWLYVNRLIGRGVNIAPTEALIKVLSMVRGKPLAAAEDWIDIQTLRTDIESSLSDAAHELVDPALDDTDLTLARWATSRGLAASPDSETLLTDRLRTERQAGNKADVERLARKIAPTPEPSAWTSLTKHGRCSVRSNVNMSTSPTGQIRRMLDPTSNHEPRGAQSDPTQDRGRCRCRPRARDHRIGGRLPVAQRKPAVPSLAPTASSAIPHETDQERTMRLDKEAAEKAYLAAAHEGDRLAIAGGANAATKVLEANAAGAYLDSQVASFRQLKRQGLRIDQATAVTVTANPAGVPPRWDSPPARTHQRCGC